MLFGVSQICNLPVLVSSSSCVGQGTYARDVSGLLSPCEIGQYLEMSPEGSKNATVNCQSQGNEISQWQTSID
jgi:hypothetical protein